MNHLLIAFGHTIIILNRLLNRRLGNSQQLGVCFMYSLNKNQYKICTKTTIMTIPNSEYCRKIKNEKQCDSSKNHKWDGSILKKCAWYYPGCYYVEMDAKGYIKLPMNGLMGLP